MLIAQNLLRESVLTLSANLKYTGGCFSDPWHPVLVYRERNAQSLQDSVLSPLSNFLRLWAATFGSGNVQSRPSRCLLRHWAEMGYRADSILHHPAGATINAMGAAIVQGRGSCFAAQGLCRFLPMPTNEPLLPARCAGSIGTAGVPESVINLSMVF